MQRTKYRCSNPECGAVDLDRGSIPPTPVVLNCHKCHAGFRMERDDMIAKHVGMFPYEIYDTETKQTIAL